MLARTHRILALLVACLALSAVAAAGAHAADAPLSNRFAETLRGDVRSIGNTLMSCPSSSACTRARDRTATGSGLNNDFTMGFVDTDGDGSTVNSSSADLSLPAGATIAWAGLYWGADSSAGSGGNAGSTSTRDRVRFRVPGGSYQTVTGSVLTSSTQTARYRGFADVTSLVSAGARSGRYWVANVAAGTGADRYAGWGLIVAYRDATQAIRRVNVLDGLASVAPGRSLAATVAPFFTPAGGAVRTNSGVLAFEGDAGITGDSLRLNGVAAGDALNPADNVFNSTVAVDGRAVSSRNPSYANTLGVDLDSTTATGVLANGQASAVLAADTTSDSFYVSAFYLVSDEGPAVNSARPQLSGTPRDGSVLSATAGSWNGTPSITYGYEWQRCDASGSACAAIPGATSAAYAVTGADVDATLRAVVTARNDAGSSAPAASPVTAAVTQRPPVNTTVPVVSGTPRDGSALTTTLGTWSGTGPLDYTVHWLRCDADGTGCTEIPDALTTSYTATADDVGHALRSQVTAANRAGSATAMSTAGRPVGAKPPSLLDAPVLSGVAREGQTLTATPGDWAGTPPLEYGYQWERCAADGSGCGAIPGATSAGYVLTPADVGRRVRVAVTAHNAAGSAVARSQPSDVVAAAVARNTAPPTVAGPDAARVLRADPGTWAGTLGPISYQWQRCSAQGSACADIAGATDAAYTLAEADGGRMLRVAVTMTNAAGPATALSAARGPMPYPAPVNLVPPSIAGAALRGSVLTARPGAWHALGAPVLGYRWQRCDAAGDSCAPISGATAAKYTAVVADVGHALRVDVTVTNDGGSATATSDATGAVAQPPVVTPTPTPSASPAPASSPAAGGVAGVTDSRVPDVASVPGSLVADASCQLLRGTRKRQVTLPGLGVVVLRATAPGAITAATPLRLTLTGARRASAAFALDGRPLVASGRRVRVAPARLGAPGAHALTVTLHGGSGGDQAVVLSLRTAPCLARFTGRRSPSGLRLRVDARTALTRVAFTVPARLLPRQSAEARPVGTLRLLVAGEAGPRTAGLVLPARGSSARLLGTPVVRATRTGLLVTGLPPGTAAVELSLARTPALDGPAPRGAITLRATVSRAGARSRTLALHTR